jgi:hypothetical protein
MFDIYIYYLSMGDAFCFGVLGLFTSYVSAFILQH